jgi:hypothetical protein
MQIRIWPAAAVGILLTACAASPQKPPAGTVAARTTSAIQNPDTPYDARIAEAAKRAKEMGYHVETRHGEQFYCRTVAPIGSRLTSKECLTVDSMIQTARMAEENRAAQMQSQLCQGPGCVPKVP